MFVPSLAAVPQVLFISGMVLDEAFPHVRVSQVPKPFHVTSRSPTGVISRPLAIFHCSVACQLQVCWQVRLSLGLFVILSVMFLYLFCSTQLIIPTPA